MLSRANNPTWWLNPEIPEVDSAIVKKLTHHIS